MDLSRWLTGYRILMVILQIIIVSMLIIAVYPVATQEISVTSVGEVQFDIDENYLVIEVPVNITNHGFFDINNIALNYTVTNATTFYLSHSNIVGSVKGGTSQRLLLPVKIDLQKIYQEEQPNFYHFFHGDKMHLNITLSLQYMMNMITVKSHYSTDIIWKPPIKNYGIGQPTNISMKDGKLILTLPFYLNTQKYLKGNIYIAGMIKNSKGDKIGNFKTSARLGGLYHGVAEMIFSESAVKNLLTRSDTLSLYGNFTFLGLKFPFNLAYQWGAPLDNFNATLLTNGIQYSFVDSSPFSYHFLINISFYNGNSLVNTTSEKVQVSPGEKVLRYVKFPSEAFNRIIVEIYDADTGLYFKEVVG